VPISGKTLPSIPDDDSEAAPDRPTGKKLLKSAVSDYIDRIVGGHELHQRVITQPRPIRDIDGSDLLRCRMPFWTPFH
jgi:hypothetical protein